MEGVNNLLKDIPSKGIHSIQKRGFLTWQGVLGPHAIPVYKVNDLH